MPNKIPVLASGDIERLLRALVRAEQDELVRQGTLSYSHHVDNLTGLPEALEFSDLCADETGLGFDSLARLALVERVNRFFGLSATGVEDYLLVRRSMRDWVDLIAYHVSLVGADTQLTFSTSGSTGAPGHHTHTWSALLSEADAHVEGVLAKQGDLRRVLVSVPVHHIYGFLWGVLIPCRLGVSVLDLPPGAPGPLTRSAQPGDLVVTTPFGWQALARSDARLPEGVAGISSGGPTTEQTWTEARQVGLQTLIEIYGSSETGGLGWRMSVDQPFSLCADVMAKRSGSDPDPALFRPGKADPLEVQDHLEWFAPSLFKVCGRKDKQVQVGGVNVSPAHVVRVLEELPQVQAAAVRLGGERLKAFIVPASEVEDMTALEHDLRGHLKSLPAPARPDQFSFGLDLPRTASGKLMDWNTA